MAQWLTPGPAGTPVDGRWVEYPPANTGGVARWDATGAIYSASGWIDIWAGPVPSAIGAAVWGPVSGYEIAELQSPAGTLMLVPQESGGAWTLTVRAGSETGTVLASTPWAEGQRIAIGYADGTCHVRCGTMDFSSARAATSVFFCFPDGTPRLRDVQVGTWPLPGAVTVDSITLDGPVPGARAVTIEAVTFDGPLPPGSRPAAVTVESITLDGPVALAVHPDPANPTAVGPGQTLALLAALADGTTATWAWRRISGPAVALLADGPRCQITGPSIMPPNPQLLVLGVRATVGTQTSPETQVTVRVLPQVSWTRHATATVGRRTAPAQ